MTPETMWIMLATPALFIAGLVWIAFRNDRQYTRIMADLSAQSQTTYEALDENQLEIKDIMQGNHIKDLSTMSSILDTQIHIQKDIHKGFKALSVQGRYNQSDPTGAADKG